MNVTAFQILLLKCQKLNSPPVYQQQKTLTLLYTILYCIASKSIFHQMDFVAFVWCTKKKRLLLMYNVISRTQATLSARFNETFTRVQFDNCFKLSDQRSFCNEWFQGCNNCKTNDYVFSSCVMSFICPFHLQSFLHCLRKAMVQWKIDCTTDIFEKVYRKYAKNLGDSFI